MNLHKLVLCAGDLAAASAVAEILEALNAPEALAVSTCRTGCARPDGRAAADAPAPAHAPASVHVPASVHAPASVHVPAPADAADWQVEAIYAQPPQTGEILKAVASVLPDIAAMQPSIIVSAVADENWVALTQASLPPVQAGRFVIHGSHDRGRIGRRPMAIEIDAGEAFGTAHHQTTRGCLEALDRLTRVRQFHHVLDLGCGSAILAIAAARALPHARAILASDIDNDAVSVARRNVRQNRLGGRIRVLRADGLADARLRRTGQFDLVLANILARPLIAMAPGIAQIVRHGGLAVLSGLLVEQANEVIGAFRSAGFELKRHQRIDEWSMLTLQRRRPCSGTGRVGSGRYGM